MPEVKNAFIKSKMNKDLDDRLIPSGEYRDAQNVQISRSEGSDVGALENVLGNKEILFSSAQSSFSTLVGAPNIKCIGQFVDENNTTITGFLAHEVQEIFPHATSGEKDEMETIKDADGQEQTIIKPQGIDKSDLVPLLTKSLQEAMARIETLEAKVIALESE